MSFGFVSKKTSTTLVAGLFVLQLSPLSWGDSLETISQDNPPKQIETIQVAEDPDISVKLVEAPAITPLAEDEVIWSPPVIESVSVQTLDIPEDLGNKTTTVPVSESTNSNLPVSEYQEMFTRYADNFGIDKNQLQSIAWCESHYNPQALNGDYHGMFQFSTSTWISTRQAMQLDTNPELRTNPEEAIHTAAFKIASGGIRAWSGCL